MSVSEETPAQDGNGRRPVPRRLIIVTVLVVLIGGGVWGYNTLRAADFVDLDDAAVTAPQVDLHANAGGTLSEVYASVGDQVRAHRPIARVGSEVVTADVTGTVVFIREDIGAEIAPGTVVASLIEPGDLRIVGQVEEDAGLSALQIGQRAVVQIDAFGGQDFAGSVEEISERPHKPQVSFNIADRDQAQEYDVTVRLDDPPPGIRQGMSAEIEVHK